MKKKKNEKMLSVLITGSSGFVGSNLINYLLNISSNLKIYSIYNKTKPKKSVNKNIKYIKANLLIYEDLRKLPNKFDLVVHLAGTRDSFLTKKEGQAQILNNIVITTNILNKMIKSKCEKIIFLSSVYVYSGTKVHNKNSNIISTFPIEPLGKSKFFCESIIENISKVSPLKCICLRAFTIYGKGSDKNQFVSSTINKFKSKNKSISFGNGSIMRDFIYIEDVCRAIFYSFNKFKDLKGDFLPMDLASGKSISVKTSVKTISKILNIKKQCNFGQFYKKRRIGDNNHYANISKISKFLQWNPMYSFEQGMREFIK